MTSSPDCKASGPKGYLRYMEVYNDDVVDRMSLSDFTHACMHTQYSNVPVTRIFSVHAPGLYVVNM